MEGGIDLSADLECGDLFHLFALVSSGQLSISPCLPDEGVGEAEDLRSSKRKIESNECLNTKKLKSLVSESEMISRREKGFPGIMVSVYRAESSASNCVDFFKDDDTSSGEKHFGGNDRLDRTSVIPHAGDCDSGGAHSQGETNMNVNDVHKVTTLSSPEEVAERSYEKQTCSVPEGCMEFVSARGHGDNESSKFTCGKLCVPILPWINGDGTINKIIYKGLRRRVLGIVMQNPGILEVLCILWVYIILFMASKTFLLLPYVTFASHKSNVAEGGSFTSEVTSNINMDIQSYDYLAETFLLAHCFNFHTHQALLVSAGCSRKVPFAAFTVNIIFTYKINTLVIKLLLRLLSS